VRGSIYKPNRISKTFSKLRDKAKISSNKHLHSLRHTFALRKLLELGNIYLVKEMLGHSSVITTQIYLQFPDGYIKEVLADWLPQANNKVDNETMKIAKLLQQNGYSQSLKN
jgi:site-specific recombinase XerD